MDEKQIAEMMEMMEKLGPQKVRVIEYEIKGGHDCRRSSNLMNCCGEQRCQACHIPHLRSKHGEAAVHAYTKFAAVQTLTWKGKEYKTPLKTNKPVTKSNKSNKKAVSKPAPAPKVPKTTREIAASIPADQLADIMAMLEKLGMK